MLLQILANAGRVMRHGNPVRAQMSGGADARHHQQLRGAEGCHR